MERQSGVHHGFVWDFHSSSEEDSGAIKKNVSVLHSLDNAETQRGLNNPNTCGLGLFTRAMTYLRRVLYRLQLFVDHLL